MKRGLVLEGGGMRGMFTAGVIDVMMEQGIEYDGAVGVSAGAVFGCNYKSRQIGRAIRYNLRFCKDPRYCSVRSLMKTGDLFGTDFCSGRSPTSWIPLTWRPIGKIPWSSMWSPPMSSPDSPCTTSAPTETNPI